MSVYCPKCVSYHETRACEDTPDDQAGSELASPSGSAWPEKAAVLRKAETAVDELTGDIIDGRISGIRAEYIQALIDGYCALRHSTPNGEVSDHGQRGQRNENTGDGQAARGSSPLKG